MIDLYVVGTRLTCSVYIVRYTHVVSMMREEILPVSDSDLLTHLHFMGDTRVHLLTCVE